MKKTSFFGFLIVTLAISSCKEFEPVVFSGIESAKVLSIKNKNAELELNIKIKNPNNFGFNIYPSNFEVKVGNNNIGEAHLKNKVRIKANSEITNKFIVQTDLSKILAGGIGSLVSIFQSKKISVTVHGELKSGNFFYRKKFPIDLQENISLDQ